ncbi:hypothetical protein [Zunongwangia sp. H14]|uniref:hypothetical protein n=1 Tax=Zunongwangia sp. H14 TaxID=3240792 RepID=UPI003562487E
MSLKEEYKKDLLEDLRYSVSKFDTQVLTIASGAIAISLTFIKEIVPIKYAVAEWLFLLALMCFIICLTLGFISHYLSIKKISESIDKIDENRIEEITSEEWIPKINLGMVIILPLGILLLTSYSLINMKHYKEISNKPKRTITIEGTKIHKNGK